MEQHFGTIPEIPFCDALLRYGKERQRENPDGYAASTRYRLQLLLDRFGHLNASEIDLLSIQDFADERLDAPCSLGNWHRHDRFRLQDQQ